MRKLDTRLMHPRDQITEVISRIYLQDIQCQMPGDGSSARRSGVH